MIIYSWNVNGIRAAEKKGFIQWVKDENPDILCIQETKIQQDQVSDELKNILSYKSFFNSAHKKGYSGTAVYYKKEPLKIWAGLPETRFNSEGRTICMEYENFILLNIYFPNGKQSEERLKFKMDFYECFLAYAVKLMDEGKQLIICGDYNTAHNDIDLKNPKPNSKYSGYLRIERDWIDKFIENGFVDIFRYLYPDTVSYTWWSYMFNARTNNSGWRIDYFFISENLIKQIKDAKIHSEIMGSDHCPISINIK